MHFGKVKFNTDTIITCIRLYLSYEISYGDVSEIMLERGIKISHTTIYRWVIKYTLRFLRRFKKVYNRSTLR